MRARDTGLQKEGAGRIRRLIVTGLIACSLSALAHQGEEHVMHPTSEPDNMAMEDLTYVAHVDRVIGGQPFRTVGRLVLGGSELQLSEVRSDGRLLRLQTMQHALSAVAFAPFEQQRVTVPPGVLSSAADLQVESLPALVIAAQSQDGSLRLYDRTRSGNTNHPYHGFVARFDAAMQDAEAISARSGAYLQVLPYVGDGPADYQFASPPDDMTALIRQPFRFHYAGDGGHAVVGGAFVVLPRRPVLVDVGGERFIFYVYLHQR